MTTLPELTVEQFSTRLRPWAELPEAAVARLHRHYELLLVWNERLSLVGPGTADEIVERHYGESVAALPWLEEADPHSVSGPRNLLDVGSGAGFPGLVIAVCRPDLHVTLLEARARKVAFLARAIQVTGCCAQTVEGFLDRTLPPGLPETLHFATLRAVKPSVAAWRALRARMHGDGRVLQWSGPETMSPPSPDFRPIGEAPIPSGRRRTIRVFAPAASRTPSGSIGG